jgi:uncharacterized protein (TIGR03032 family)
MTAQRASGAAAPRRGPGVEVTGSRHFTDWLDAAGASLAVTTYHGNRLFLLGIKDEDGAPRLSVYQRVFERAMGCAARGDELLLATRFQLWRLQNILRAGEREGRYDRVYKPHLAWTTGDIDIHDIVVGADRAPLFACALLSCLATVDDRHSLRPLWRPRFISALQPEDRCHLNGLAAEDGRARFVTAVARSDVAGGWRQQRERGGIVVDVESSEIVASGLSMPHSPRLHPRFPGELLVLNSGTGELGRVELASGRFEPICFCPGYLRGLAFWDRFAIVGSSQCREERTFSGLELDERLRAKGAEARCGVMVIDLATGAVVHWLELGGPVRELYDVQVLPGVRCPKAIGLQNKEIWGVVTFETEDGRIVRHTGVVED